MNSRWVKPTVDTKFHIDRTWWEEKGRNFRVHLLSHLCAECQARYKNYEEADVIDWVDADTGEVCGCCVRAATTVSFQFAKRGSENPDAAPYLGRLVVADIGIPDVCADDAAWSELRQGG